MSKLIYSLFRPQPAVLPEGGRDRRTGQGQSRDEYQHTVPPNKNTAMSRAIVDPRCRPRGCGRRRARGVPVPVLSFLAAYPSENHLGFLDLTCRGQGFSLGPGSRALDLLDSSTGRAALGVLPLRHAGPRWRVTPHPNDGCVCQVVGEGSAMSCWR